VTSRFSVYFVHAAHTALNREILCVERYPAWIVLLTQTGVKFIYYCDGLGYKAHDQ